MPNATTGMRTTETRFVMVVVGHRLRARRALRHARERFGADSGGVSCDSVELTGALPRPLNSAQPAHSAPYFHRIRLTHVVTNYHIRPRVTVYGAFPENTVTAAAKVPAPPRRDGRTPKGA